LKCFGVGEVGVYSVEAGAESESKISDSCTSDITQWSVMQQCNICHNTVDIVASGYAQPGRRVSILKCTASQCERSTQTLLISHLLQFQIVNLKNH